MVLKSCFPVLSHICREVYYFLQYKGLNNPHCNELQISHSLVAQLVFVDFVLMMDQSLSESPIQFEMHLEISVWRNSVISSTSEPQKGRLLSLVVCLVNLIVSAELMVLVIPSTSLDFDPSTYNSHI